VVAPAAPRHHRSQGGVGLAKAKAEGGSIMSLNPRERMWNSAWGMRLRFVSGELDRAVGAYERKLAIEGDPEVKGTYNIIIESLDSAIDGVDNALEQIKKLGIMPREGGVGGG